MKLILSVLLALTAIVTLRAQDASAPQSWTSSDGRVVQAKFIKLDGESVVIEKDGTQFAVALSKLNADSVALAKKLASTGPASPTAPAVPASAKIAKPSSPATVAAEAPQESSFPSAIGPLPPNELSESFGQSTPEKEGISTEKLAELTEWVRDSKKAIFSILISRNGKLVYELYTTSLGRDEAHYLMSVTKSFTSALVGIATDKGLLPDPDSPVTKSLPRSLFASDADFNRFGSVSIKHVMGMSALDATIAPHSKTEDAAERLRQYLTVENRPKFALTQKLLPEPGKSFQYTDFTPLITTALIQYGTGKSAMDFAEEALFGPLGFRNAEWMHQDRAGFDNGSYGLRLRPIDMQKFGILFMNGGAWNGRQLISRSWVERSFQPWIQNAPKRPLNYGWFWWFKNYGPGWDIHEANGWKGQRIIVVPQQRLVVTMTCYIEGSEETCETIMKKFVVAAIPANQKPLASAVLDTRLSKALADVHSENRMPSAPQERMVPTVKPKEKHRRFDPNRMEVDTLGIVKADQFNAPPNQPGKSGYVELTHQRQEKNLSVTTSAAMVLHRFGSSATAREVKVLSRNKKYDPAAEFNDFTGTLFRDLISAVAKLGFTWRNQAYPRTEDGAKTGLGDIKRSIDQGNPVLLDTMFFGGHVLVANGYDDAAQNLIIVDSNIQAPGIRMISYKHFEEIWNSSSFNGRACVFTAPKL